MTSEKELRQIARDEVRRSIGDAEPLWEDFPELTENEFLRVIDLHDTWPIPDLPEPHCGPGRWKADGVRTSPATGGSVILEWFDREDNGPRIIERHLNLSPAQVQAIIAAHYHREDQE